MAWENLYRGLASAGENIAQGIRHTTENMGRLFWHDLARKEDAADDLRNQKRVVQQDLAGLVKDIALGRDTERRQNENQSRRDALVNLQTARQNLQENPDIFGDEADALLAEFNRLISGVATGQIKPEAAGLPLNYLSKVAAQTKKQRESTETLSGLKINAERAGIAETQARTEERLANAGLKASKTKDDNTIVYADGQPLRLGDAKQELQKIKDEINILKASGAEEDDAEVVGLAKRWVAINNAKPAPTGVELLKRPDLTIGQKIVQSVLPTGTNSPLKLPAPTPVTQSAQADTTGMIQLQDKSGKRYVRDPKTGQLFLVKQ